MAVDLRRRAVPIGLAAACLLVYAWRLDYSPPFLADDEVMFALQAHAVATTAQDLSGRLLPLYFQMTPLGGNSWFHPALVYFSVPFLWVLRFSEATVRFPTAVIGLVDIVLLYFVARRVTGQSRMALLAASLLALTPAHFMLSRLTADYLVPVPFVLAWLLCLFAFLDRDDPRWLVGGTVCLGLGAYTYIASVIMMPVYLAITLAVIAHRRKAVTREAALAIAGFALPLLLVPLWLAFHPQVVRQTLARYGQTARVPLASSVRARSIGDMLREVRQPSHLSGIVGRISLLWYFFDPAYLFVAGGYANPINSTRHTAVFLLPFAVFVPVGAWRLATRAKTVPERLMLVGFVTAPLAALWVPEPYAIDREAALLAFGAVVATVGVTAMYTDDRRWVRGAVLILLALVPLQFAAFAYDYFGPYRGQVAAWFGANHRDAVEDIIARTEREAIPAVYLTRDGDPAVQAYWTFALIKWHRQDLESRAQLYDPAAFDPAAIPPGSLILASPENRDMTRLVAAGALRKLRDIPEIADPPRFMILQR